MPLDEDVVAAIYREHGAALRRNACWACWLTPSTTTGSIKKRIQDTVLNPLLFFLLPKALL